MMDGYRNIFNGHGLKSLLKNPLTPPPNLAIGDDDERADIPLVIFTEQGTMPRTAKVPHASELPYEKTAEKGVNDSLSTQNFVVDDFDIGEPFAGI